MRNNHNIKTGAIIKTSNELKKKVSQRPDWILKLSLLVTYMSVMLKYLNCVNYKLEFTFNKKYPFSSSEPGHLVRHSYS